MSVKRKYNNKKYNNKKYSKKFKPFVPVPELKFHDIVIDDAVVATAGTIAIDSVFKITQGTGESQRIGRQIQVKSINWRFECRLPIQSGGGGGSSDVVRVILYQDKQANGAIAVKDDIVEDSADWQTFNNLANRKRFLTLMDRTFTLNQTAGAGDGATNDWADTTISDTFFKKCNILVEYDGATNALTELQSNNIGLLLLCRTGLASFESIMRIRYYG